MVDVAAAMSEILAEKDGEEMVGISTRESRRD